MIYRAAPEFTPGPSKYTMASKDNAATSDAFYEQSTRRTQVC